MTFKSAIHAKWLVVNPYLFKWNVHAVISELDAKIVSVHKSDWDAV